MRIGPVVLLIILSFPLLEAIGIVWVFGKIGWWVVVWLMLAAMAGVTLIRFERVAWSLRMVSTLQSGTHPIASLFASGRMLLAGGLLIFPGFISDIIALTLLLLPGTWMKNRATPRAANDDVLEGEFRRETDDNGRLR